MNRYEHLIIEIKRLNELLSEVTRPEDNEFVPEQYLFLLFMIYRTGKIKTTELSHYYSITPGAATAIADKLEKMGLISRERDDTDRRIILITLTQMGQEYVETKISEHITLFANILHDYSPEDLDNTLQTLSRLSTAITTYAKKDS